MFLKQDKPEMDMSCIISIDGTGHSERGGGYIKNRYSIDTLAKMSQNIFFILRRKKSFFSNHPSNASAKNASCF